MAAGENTDQAARPIRDQLIHITDLHFWRLIFNPLQLMSKRFVGNLNVFLRRRHEFIMHRAEEFADVAAATGVETFLLTGDFTSTSTHEEFRIAVDFVHYLEQKGLHVISIPGNHDVYTFEGTRRKRFEQYFAPFLTPESYPSKLTLAGGTPLVLVPTVTPNIISSKGRITNREIREAAEMVAACAPGPVVVAGHYPMLTKTYAYDSKPSRQLRNAERLRHALGETGREILYLSGHVHRFSYVEDVDYPHLHHMTTAAFFLRRHLEQIHGEFSEVHIDSEGFHIYRHCCDESWDRVKHTVRPVLG